jgi:hypothetical protein
MNICYNYINIEIISNIDKKLAIKSTCGSCKERTCDTGGMRNMGAARAGPLTPSVWVWGFTISK